MIDRHLRHEYAGGRWKFETFDLTSDLCVGQGQMFRFTFKGEMRFSYVLNDARCERRVVEGILESICQILLDGILAQAALGVLGL